MGKVAISCDSVSVLPGKARELGFTMIPCPIIMDGNQCPDTEIDMDELQPSSEGWDEREGMS